jgi:mono/diheme cytochrome c family protein
VRRAAPLALVAIALLAAGCGGGGAGTRGIPQGADLNTGRKLFSQKCGSCHTLAAASAQGTIGPNLDNAFGYSKKQGFADSTVYDITLRQIQLAAPPMPDDLVKGSDAEAVAAFVANCAGTNIVGKQAAVNPACQTGGKIQGNDPTQLFTAAGCAGCHTFSKVSGAHGTVGPNLDQAHPTLARAQLQITQGGGGMPPFGNRLTNAQIQALAKFVSGG